MSGTRSGSGPVGIENGSWASETLPLSVRKELLERELKKLGFRRAEAGRSATGGDAGAGQQEAATAGHPQADGAAEHGG